MNRFSSLLFTSVPTCLRAGFMASLSAGLFKLGLAPRPLRPMALPRASIRKASTRLVSTHSAKNKSQCGFSLLELAIALAVLALLAGGVLKGRELIQSARIQAVATDLGNLETAVSAFESRYTALPGDFVGAAAAALSATGGDGNGQIDTAQEEQQVFAHLQQAGFVRGDYAAPGTPGATCPPSACMVNPLGGVYVISHNWDTPTLPANPLGILVAESAPARSLAEIDRKLDDGNPNRGALQVVSADSEACVTGNQWNEAAGNTCAAVYFVR